MVWRYAIRTLKVISLIALIIYFICFVLIIVADTNYDPESVVGFGNFGILYAISFSIVVLIKSASKRRISTSFIAAELINLNDLKDKKIINEEEFNQKKHELLSL